MKTLREYIDQLDEISRRDFLKGAGAAAVTGAAGVGVGVRKIADNRAAEKLGEIYGLLDNLKPDNLEAYELKTNTLNFLDQYEKKLPNLRSKDWMGDDWYKHGFTDSQIEFKQEFPNGVKTPEDLKKFKTILTVHIRDFVQLAIGHPGYTVNKENIDQDLEEASPDAVARIEELVKYK